MKKLTREDFCQVLHNPRDEYITINKEGSKIFSIMNQLRDKGFELDFSKLDLSEINFSVNYDEEIILDLSNANFSDSSLYSCNFKHCILDNADFTDALIARSSFSHAKLRYANFSKAIFHIESTKPWYDTVDFASADLRYSNLNNVPNNMINFENTNLHGTEFDKSRIVAKTKHSKKFGITSNQSLSHLEATKKGSHSDGLMKNSNLIDLHFQSSTNKNILRANRK